jgi:hypothetical protein
MGSRFRRGRFPVALAVLGLLGCWPGFAQAHPLLVGKWSAAMPPGTTTVYDFAPGKYLGCGVWDGPFLLVIAGMPISTGHYQLYLFNGTQGTLALRDGNWISTRVGILDLGTRVLSFMGINYQHSIGVPLPPAVGEPTRPELKRLPPASLP